MGLLGDWIKRKWDQADRENVQNEVKSLIGQAPSPQYSQMSTEGIPVDEYIKSSPMDVRAGTGALASGQLDVQKLAQGLIATPETQNIGAQLLNNIMTQAQAEKAAEASQNLEQDKINYTREKDLRGEFSKETKTFVDINDAYGRIQASSADPTPAGDLSLIFNYMKMLDPGSVVRESEFATAENAASVPERVRKVYNKMISGEKLTHKQRTDFIDRAGKLYNKSLEGFNKRRAVYEDLAKGYGVDPTKATFSRGIHDQYAPNEETKNLLGAYNAPADQSPIGTPPLPSGFVRDR